MQNDKVQTKTPPIVISDEDDWPELSPEDVQVEFIEAGAPSARDRNAQLLTLLLGALFLIYSLYAMGQGDQPMVQSGFDFVKLALAASVSWTFGRRSLSSR